MRLKISDERAVLVADEGKTYQESDKETWLTAFGAVDIEVVTTEEALSEYFIVTFPEGKVNIPTLYSGFGPQTEVVLKGNNLLSLSSTPVGSIPVYLIDYIHIYNAPM